MLELSRAQSPHLRRVLVGFSLSGNLALLLAAGVTPQPSRPLPPVSGPPTPSSAAPSGSQIPPSAAPTGASMQLSAAPSGQPTAHDTRSAAAPPPPAPASSPSPASPAAASIPCEAVLAINPPVDLASAADRTHRGFNRLYELRFVARLRRDITLLARSGLHPTAPIGPFTTLRNLDDRFTAPVSGFASAAEYYERCSSLPHLARIRIPTVILTSLDDPLVDATPLLTAPLSPSTQLHAERHGGHMGYLSRRTPLRWLDTALRHCLA